MRKRGIQRNNSRFNVTSRLSPFRRSLEEYPLPLSVTRNDPNYRPSDSHSRRRSPRGSLDQSENMAETILAHGKADLTRSRETEKNARKLFPKLRRVSNIRSTRGHDRMDSLNTSGVREALMNDEDLEDDYGDEDSSRLDTWSKASEELPCACLLLKLLLEWDR